MEFTATGTGARRRRRNRRIKAQTNHNMSTNIETRYGFIWNGTQVSRCCSDPKWGILLLVQTPKQELEIRVTPTGLVRVSKPKEKSP